jgi:hypothetical protein
MKDKIKAFLTRKVDLPEIPMYGYLLFIVACVLAGILIS